MGKLYRKGPQGRLGRSVPSNVCRELVRIVSSGKPWHCARCVNGQLTSFFYMRESLLWIVTVFTISRY